MPEGNLDAAEAADPLTARGGQALLAAIVLLMCFAIVSVACDWRPFATPQEGNLFLLAVAATAIFIGLVLHPSAGGVGMLLVLAGAALFLLLLIGALLGEVKGWLFAIGLLLNFGVIGGFLLVRNSIRARRLEVVAYLTEFLIDAKDGAEQPIEPASLRLALEKYLLEHDGSVLSKRGWPLFERRLAQKIDLWQDLLEVKNSPDCSDREAIIRKQDLYNDIAFLLQRAKDMVAMSNQPAAWFRALFGWLPAFFPFLALAGFFFVQFSPGIYPPPWTFGLCSDCAPPAPYWGAFWTLDAGTDFEKALLIATFAFSGAYIHTLREMVRGVVSYDLSPSTFLRAFRHAATAVAVAVVAWYALTSVEFQVRFAPNANAQEQSETPSSTPTPVSTEAGAPTEGEVTTENETTTPPSSASQPERDNPSPPFSLFFPVLAFVIGLYPDLGIGELVKRSRIEGLKKQRPVYAQVETVPVEIIDGVDYGIRMRMDEFGIVDVQNLATANPILLFVETPMFGLSCCRFRGRLPKLTPLVLRTQLG